MTLGAIHEQAARAFGLVAPSPELTRMRAEQDRARMRAEQDRARILRLRDTEILVKRFETEAQMTAAFYPARVPEDLKRARRTANPLPPPPPAPIPAPAPIPPDLSALWERLANSEATKEAAKELLSLWGSVSTEAVQRWAKDNK
jgi:hypothetical protein